MSSSCRTVITNSHPNNFAGENSITGENWITRWKKIKSKLWQDICERCWMLIQPICEFGCEYIRSRCHGWLTGRFEVFGGHSGSNLDSIHPAKVSDVRPNFSWKKRRTHDQDFGSSPRFISGYKSKLKKKSKKRIKHTSISSSPFKNPHPLWGCTAKPNQIDDALSAHMATLESLKETILSM